MAAVEPVAPVPGGAQPVAAELTAAGRSMVAQSVAESVVPLVAQPVDLVQQLSSQETPTVEMPTSGAAAPHRLLLLHVLLVLSPHLLC